MRFQTFNPARMSIPNVHGRLTYTVSQCKADAHAAVYAPTFEALRNKCNVVYAKEVALSDTIIEAQALVDSRGVRLDEFASRLSKAVLTITRDNRVHFLYVLFFANKTLSEFLKPNFGEQLGAMRAWPKRCAASEHAAIKELGVELEPLLKECIAALDARTDAEQERKIFREGERRKFFDEVNVERKSAYGELSKLPHIHTGLPLDYADMFFRNGKDSGADEDEDEDEPPTVESVQGAIASLKEQIAVQEKLLAELQAENAKAQQVEADKAALAVIEKSMAEQAAIAAALKAKIEAATTEPR